MPGDQVTSIKQTGITELHSGGLNPRADIVLVHGLGGHPQRTWSSTRSDPESAPLPARRKRNRLSSFFRLGRSPSKNGTGTNDDIEHLAEVSRKVEGVSAPSEVYWPRDLLPENFDDIRVMTFGYVSSPVSSSQDNLYTLSNNLLQAVADARIVEPTRPIIFIAHSLGGILVKSALKESQDATGVETRLQSIRKSTAGVIFFGTPHSGADLADWAQMLRRIAGVFMVTNSTLLSALNAQSNNGQLEQLGKNFNRMLGSGQDGKFTVHSFRETKPLANGPWGPVAKLVVPLSSSNIVSEWASAETIPENHRNICKFNDSESATYGALVRVLGRFLDEVGDQKGSVEEAQNPHTVEQMGTKTKWLRQLYTCPYEDRKNSPNPPRIPGTCEWFTNHPRFDTWKRRQGSLLWVSADPGCGKSVLSRYLVDEILPSTQTSTTCYFFFKDGFPDQTSSAGAICCVLRQLFYQTPAMFSDGVLFTFESWGDEIFGSFSNLWNMFISLNNPRHQIICVLDALDECSEEGRDQIIKATTELFSGGNSGNISMIITSRPYIDIGRRFSVLERQIPEIRLDGDGPEEKALIYREIDLVIKHRVGEISQTHGLLPGEQSMLQLELTKVPNRTYLWVHLIFDVFERRDSILLTTRKIQKLVEQLPRSVDQAYERILSKSPNTSLARKLLHLVVAAARPLTLDELAVAMAIKPEHRCMEDLDLVPRSRFQADIRQLCGLMITVVESRIHLLHQTVREFLVFSSPSPSDLTSSLGWKGCLALSQSNRILAEICIWRILWEDYHQAGPIPVPIKDGGRYSMARADRSKLQSHVSNSPFLGYAAEHWIRHYYLGFKKNDAPIDTAMALFSPHYLCPPPWTTVHDVVKDQTFSNFLPLASATYLGLFNIAAKLLDIRPDMARDELSMDNRALIHAIADGEISVVQKLLEVGAPVKHDRAVSSPLYQAIFRQNETAVKILIDAGACPTPQDTEDYRNQILPFAVDTGSEYAVYRLLESGAIPNEHRVQGQSLLTAAVFNNHESIVRLLLEAGANVNQQNERGRTALHSWVQAEEDNDVCSGEILELLFRHGADSNIKDELGRTAMDMAATSNEVVAARLAIAVDAYKSDS